MTRPTTTGKAQDLITFTRSTTGTYLGSDGLLKSAAINEARIEYDASGNCLGLLMEEEKTNALPYSEDFTQGNWDKPNTIITSNSAVSPDGQNNASLVTVNSASYSFVREFLTISAAANTFSVFAKAGTTSSIQLWFVQQGVTDGVASIDLSTGAVTGISGGWTGGVTTKYVGNGWYRIQGTRTFTASANNHGVGVAAIGQNGLNFYIYGAQLETGSFPSSYIPTSGSAATRADDLASLAVSEFGYNQDQGSVVVESNFFGGTDTSALCYIGEDTSDRIVLYYSNQNLSFQVKSSGATQASENLSGQRNKAAFRYKLNDIVLAGDGSITSTDTAANLLGGTQDNIYIGSYYHNAGAHLNGHIKSIKYYPVGLSNAQLQALTV